MMTASKIVISILALALLTGCGQDDKETDQHESKNGQVDKGEEKTSHYKRVRVIDGKSTTQYTGKPGRLFIVAENTIYTDELEQLIDTVFTREMRPYYPPHQYFEVYHRTPEKFEKGSVRLRNVIELVVDTSIPKGKPRMEIRKNYLSETQLYTEIAAHSINELYTFMEEELNQLFQRYESQEWKREYYRHQRKSSTTVNEKLAAKFGINLVLPSKYRYESIDDEYAIIILPERSRQMEMSIGGGGYNSTKANFIQSGVMIWQYPFEDSAQLHPDQLMRRRDSILKYHAKHEVPGVYMGTQDHPAVLPEYERFKVNGVQGFQFRGMFKFTGRMEPSGGKFWSFHFLHPHRNNIVAVSGYLDAPPTMSPSFDLNRLRAIIYSLKVTE